MTKISKAKTTSNKNSSKAARRAVLASKLASSNEKDVKCAPKDFDERLFLVLKRNFPKVVSYGQSVKCSRVFFLNSHLILRNFLNACFDKQQNIRALSDHQILMLLSDCFRKVLGSDSKPCTMSVRVRYALTHEGR